FPLVSAIIATIGFLGVVVGWYATDWFARRRERRNRVGEFVGHLLWFRHAIARHNPEDSVGIWNAYFSAILTYHSELGKIRQDFLGNKEFLTLTDALGNLQMEDVLNCAKPDKRDVICEKIDRLGQILESRSGGWA